MDILAKSQNGKVLQKPIATSKELKRPKAADYLKTVRNFVSSKSFEEFTNTLKSFKAKKMPFKQMMTTISKLFEKSENEVELLEGFRDFVPKKYIAEYQQLIEAKKSRKTGLNPILPNLHKSK
jgi:histone deacetylase complex regulatory component SIN3